jgi:hypothetical protein
MKFGNVLQFLVCHYRNEYGVILTHCFGLFEYLYHVVLDYIHK